MWFFKFKRTSNIFPSLSKRLLRKMSSHQETLALRAHFKEILKTLHEKNLEKLPWYILLGPEQSGKTTLSSHPFHQWLHTIPPLFATLAPKNTITTTPILHPVCARINQDGVFIEIPGRYLHEKTLKRNVFSTLLYLLKKNKLNTLIRGVMLVFSLDDLAKLSAQKQQEQIYLLKHCLIETAQIIKQPINLKIFLSKADTLIGFNEFFSETLQEERLDVFGIEFPEQAFSSARPTSQIFSHQFALLLKKLNERVISLLHRERLIHKKALIADFPQQIAYFKELLNRYIYDLFDTAPYQNKILLRGIYFYSNLHHGDAIDYLAKWLTSYQLPCRTHTIAAVKPKSYFVNRLLKKMAGLSQTTKMTPREIFAIPRVIVLTTAFLLVLIPALYLGIDFQQKAKALQQIQKELAISNQNKVEGDATEMLLNQARTLNSLHKITLLLEHIPLSSLIGFSWHPLHNLSSQTQQNYQNLLEQHFIPLLGNTLTQDLLNASITNSNSIYPALKAYLALGEPKKNSAYLAKWLKNYLYAAKFKTTNLTQRNLQEIDVSTWPATPLDNPAIFHAQSILNHLPKPLLAYLILKGEMIGAVDPFPQDFDKIFVYPAIARDIPIIYTRKKMADVYFDQIPMASRAAFTGNDTLGKQFFTEISPADFTSVIEQVREFYLQDYAHVWQNILTHTQIKLANNLAQAFAILEALSRKPSPLVLLLKTITEQTTLDIAALSAKRSLNEQNNFYHQFKNHFSMDDATNRLLAAKPYLVDQTVQPEIIKLKKTLENTIKAADVKKAAFSLTKAEYQNQKTFGKLAKVAFEMPQPISRWLISLISNDWLLLLQSTRSYANQIWLNLIVAEYRAKLSDRYPFTKQSVIDVELVDFAHFFSKDGTLDAFTNQYLLPFIDTNKSKWQWRELYGQSLSQRQELPLQLERASLIRKMFFSKTGELSVEFYLIPISGVLLKSMELNIDGQHVNNQTPNLTSLLFTWPGIKNRDGSSVSFLKQNGEQILLAEKGSWSLFRLLDDAYIQPMKDSKHYNVTFNLNGNPACYQLIAENAINPFIPNFITNFKCLDEF